jgi:hypothetical protein
MAVVRAGLIALVLLLAWWAIRSVDAHAHGPRAGVVASD